MPSLADLHAYQNKAIQFVLDRPCCALWLGLGLGKTVITLTALEMLTGGVQVHKALIIAPLRVANTVWAQEARLWSHTRPLAVSVCTGTARERTAALMRTADVYVINRENVPWLVEFYGKKWPFDCVVLDEASSFKNSSTSRWKALRKVRPFISRMVQLTGTPSPNGLMDLWAQMYLLDLGQRLGRTKTAFVNRFFEADYMGYNYTPRKGADTQIYHLISGITLSMSSEDYLDMPDSIDSVVRVALPDAALKAYKQLEKEFVLMLDDDEIEAMNAAVLAGKLLQMANGALYVDEERNFQILHNAKIDALRDIIDDNPDENILVAYNYKHDLHRLREAFPQAAVLDSGGKAVEQWNNGELPLLLAHPASAGHGLNLQRGGAVLVWFGLNWSLELYAQFCGRLHRQGQERPVRIIHIVADGCIDERVMQAVGQKARTQRELLTALKANW